MTQHVRHFWEIVERVSRGVMAKHLKYNENMIDVDGNLLYNIPDRVARWSDREAVELAATLGRLLVFTRLRSFRWNGRDYPATPSELRYEAKVWGQFTDVRNLNKSDISRLVYRKLWQDVDFICKTVFQLWPKNQIEDKFYYHCIKNYLPTLRLFHVTDIESAIDIIRKYHFVEAAVGADHYMKFFDTLHRRDLGQAWFNNFGVGIECKWRGILQNYAGDRAVLGEMYYTGDQYNLRGTKARKFINLTLLDVHLLGEQRRRDQYYDLTSEIVGELQKIVRERRGKAIYVLE